MFTAANINIIKGRLLWFSVKGMLYFIFMGLASGYCLFVPLKLLDVTND